MSYTEILEAVKELPENEIKDLKSQLDALLENRTSKKIDRESYRKLLLNGPIMTDQQYEEFLENRKHFNKWREKPLF